MYAYARESGNRKIAVIFNFSNELQKDYKVEIEGKKAIVLLNTEAQCYGGKDNRNITELCADEDGNIIIDMMPYSAIMFDIVF